MPVIAALTLVALQATAAVVEFGPVAPFRPEAPAVEPAQPPTAPPPVSTPPPVPAPAPAPAQPPAPVTSAPVEPRPALRGFAPIRYIETTEPTVITEALAVIDQRLTRLRVVSARHPPHQPLWIVLEPIPAQPQGHR